MGISDSSTPASGNLARKIPCERLVRTLFEKNRDLIRQEVSEVRGLMTLLMKHHNTGIIWTPAEKDELRHHLKEIAKAVPVLCIILLPFGTLFLPVLAVVIDRRSKTRIEENKLREASHA